MDGMLSQDEINALLNGMSPTDGDAGSAGSADPMVGTAPVSDADATLTDEEKDAIGEVANISMGTSATTLYSLVNRKVNITTPVVEVAKWENVIAEYEKPCVFIQIQYKVGLDGSNILILKEQDVKVITDLMMGGDGTDTGGELGELHLSAISEAMNQMMGSSATSLSSMLGKMIDISPPQASLIDLQDLANADDIEDIMLIVRQARNYLKKHRVDQWQGDYPTQQAFEDSIENGECYAVMYGKSLAGVFCMTDTPEPDYDSITDGYWHGQGKYCTVHRLAVEAKFRGTGMSDKMFAFAEEAAIEKGAECMRVDTHRKNKAMQQLVRRIGYTYRGNVTVTSEQGHDPARQAFEKKL